MTTMKAPPRAVHLLLALLAAGVSLAACAGKPRAAADAAAADVAAADVARLIGTAACSGDTDCATIGIGALACGGPQAYVAWSKQQTDAQALAAAVARQRAAREAQIARTGEHSICMVVPDPGARCNATRRCELRPAAGGGGAAAVR